MGSFPSQVELKTIKLIFVASPISTPQYGQTVRTKTGYVGVRITCSSGATCLICDLIGTKIRFYNYCLKNLEI